jgi:hypothetical protein
MFELLARFEAWKQSLAICTTPSKTSNSDLFITDDICYDAHGCCAPDFTSSVAKPIIAGQDLGVMSR